MSTLSFFVRGDPVAQPRPRVAMGHAYTPADPPIHGWKTRIALEANRHRPGVPFDGPVRVNLCFFFDRPGSHYGSKKKVRFLREDAPKWHTVKPDKDNLEKAVLDQLKNSEFFKDDSQVCWGDVKKVYYDPTGTPGVAIIIETL